MVRKLGRDHARAIGNDLLLGVLFRKHSRMMWGRIEAVNIVTPSSERRATIAAQTAVLLLAPACRARAPAGQAPAVVA